MKGGSHESLFNGSLGEILPFISKYKHIEKRGVLLNKNKQPDILVDHKDYPPVIIESSKSDKDAEKDAIARLGEKTLDGTTIQCVIAVHIPEIFHDKDTKTVRDLLRTVQLEYCIYKPHRIPSKGWIKGTAYDISNFIKSVSITHLDETINNIETILKESANILKQHISNDLIKKLHQRDQQKTANSIVILWLNTLMIQDHLSEYNKDIKKLQSLSKDKLPNAYQYLDTWNDIRKINWITIFENSIISLEYLVNKNNHDVSKVFDMLHKVINIIECQRYKKLVNIGAELFPKMSVDRKTAAAFYTNDTTAEFLANLTINEQDIDKDIFERIKIVDMACGTGTLLRAGYNVIRTNFEKYHIDDKNSLKKIHTDAIEKGLIGLDIFPISTHLTASSLTTMGYGDPYNEMNIGMMPVGGSMGKTGSLEYLDSNANYDLLTPNKKIKGVESESIEYNQIVIKNNDIDYILMNPPYSKSGGKKSVFNITGLKESSIETCKIRWKKLIGNVSDKSVVKRSSGVASSFLILASKKLKINGKLGFVLPLTAAFNETWDVTRDYFTRNFEDIIAITMSGGYNNQQLSADTALNEMLLVATKSEKPHKPYPVKCCTLETGFDHGTAIELARTVQNTIQKINNNTSTHPIFFGNDNIGNCTLFHTDGKESWSPLGSTNDYLSQFIVNLKKGIIKSNKRINKFNIKTISDVFKVGPTHHLIGHINGSSFKCGVFELYPIKNDFTVNDTSLWHIKSNIQYSILTNPTHKGIKYTNNNKEIKNILNQRGTLFYTRGYRWTTQKPISVMSNNSIMGGSTWAGLLHKDEHILKTACLWFNSIFGCLIYWSHNSRTIPGRSMSQMNAIKNTPCPDFNVLPKNKILQASKKLDELKNKYLLPGSRMHLDTIRHEIDQAIIDLFDWQISDQELTDLRNHLVNEPSIFTGEQTNLDPDEVIQYSICQDIILDGVNEPISIILTNKNVIIFNPNMTKLNDQVLKIPYSTIKSVQYKKDTIQLVLYDPPIDKRSKKYWNNNIGQITDLPINQVEKLYQTIHSNTNF